jgi:hypothetical protein
LLQRSERQSGQDPKCDKLAPHYRFLRAETLSVVPCKASIFSSCDRQTLAECPNTRVEALRVADNIAKLPGLLRKAYHAATLHLIPSPCARHRYRGHRDA